MLGLMIRMRRAISSAFETEAAIWASPPRSQKSTCAGSSSAAWRASASRSSGVPFVPDSPREHTQRNSSLPRAASVSRTPPHANSMSSGCAPTARMQQGSDFGDISAVRFGDFVAGDELHIWSVARFQIATFAGAAHVMRAPNHRLHPTQARVARRADLSLLIFFQRQFDVSVPSFVQQKAVATY